MSTKQRKAITFPRVPAYKTIGEYLTSKTYLNSLEYRNYEWDKAGHHEPRLNDFGTRRVLNEANQKLQLKREWAREEYEKIDLQWKDLQEQELKFKETFVQENEFIKSNEDKRARAAMKLKENEALTVKRVQDIEVLQGKINQVSESKKELDGNIEELHIFEEYLDGVVGLTSDFVHVNDIIRRYEALINTRNLLAKKQDDNLTELEMAKGKIAKLSEDYKFKVLGLNNIIADLNSRYNIVTRRALHWENTVLRIKKHCYDKYEDLNTVIGSVWNLYLLMCKRKGETPKYNFGENTEQMLIYIKKTLQEVNTVKELLRARKEKQKK